MAVLLGSTLALWQLLELRLELGDAYPAYSSLRADPLGTRLLFDSLQAVPGVTATRNLRALRSAELGQSTVLMLGVDAWGFRNLSRERWQPLQTQLDRGARLVVALRAVDFESTEYIRNEGSQTVRDNAALHWSFDLQERQMSAAEKQQADERRGASSVPGRDTLVTLVPRGEQWRVLLRDGERPTVMERSSGRGTLMLVNNAYWFSNEALVKERQSALLTMLVGPHRTVVFDETHLGVEEGSSIAQLARRYGLGLPALLLLTLAGLGIWMNSTSLLPPVPDTLDTGAIRGGAASESLTGLLRQSIPADQLLATAYALGQRLRRGTVLTTRKREQAETVLAQHNAANRSPEAIVRDYQRVHAILSQKELS